VGATAVVAELMERTGVRFGTSGLRGLADALTDEVVYGTTRAFLDHLAARGLAGPARRAAVAGDLRPSTPRIMAAVRRAFLDAGFEAEDCGFVPTPALAARALAARMPAAMVTGSHIPDDRNGVKYYRPDGEILKGDEAAILARTAPLDAPFDARGALPAPPPAAAPDIAAPDTAARDIAARDTAVPDPAARLGYARRFVEAFPADWLRGARIGLYEHSAVGRDLTREILEALGADVVPFGRSGRFVPVDTEAIRPEDEALARDVAAEGRFFALVSTDGDGDRPLLADERGAWLRGDVLGVLAARFFGADVVVTPVSSNSVVERCGAFRDVRRTKIGSPYVIEAMARAAAEGARAVVGYEANGGFLTATPTAAPRGPLSPLPTRDALAPILAALGAALRAGGPLSALGAALPARFTHSDRLRDFPPEVSAARLAELRAGGAAAAARLFPWLPPVASIDETDGVRMTLVGGDVVHLRPSGNAPELRCYAEAGAPDEARALAERTLADADAWRRR